MKPKSIYFDGCSWTRGSELELPELERFSKLLSDHYDCRETNFGKSGGSNDRIVRNLIVENNIKSMYDLAIIQMSCPARTEFYFDYEKQWIRINPSYNFSKAHYKRPWKRKSVGQVDGGSKSNFHYDCPLCGTKTKKLSEKFTREAEFWHDYYRVVTSEEFFDTKEEIHYHTIKNHCQVNNIPLIIMSINKWTRLDFDLQLDVQNLPRAPKAHPTKEGHRMIADELIKLIDQI